MSDEVKPRRRWGRWLFGGAAAVVMVAVMAYAVNDQSLRGGVAGAGRELDASDPGWRLDDLLAARPEVAEADNSAAHLLAVAARLPAGWPDEREAAKLEGLAPNAALNAGQRAALAALLKGVPREAARELVRHRRGRFEGPAGRVPWGAAPEADRAFAALRALRYDAGELAAAGRTDDALASARAILSVARSLEDDPTEVGQWLRLTAPELGFAAVERALALGEASDAALAEVAADLAPASVTRALRTQRAMMHETLAAVGRGERDPIEVTRSFGLQTPAMFEFGGPMLRREWARREHPHLLRLMTRMVEASRLPGPKQFAEDDAVEREFAKASGVFTKLTGGLLKGVNAQGRRVAALALSMRALLAVERYRLKHKAWPAKLEDVVPAFLDKVPDDPIDGKPLRFSRTADGVVVYSIGNDRTDDGGDVGKLDKDYGYRLWDADKRRAAAPP